MKGAGGPAPKTVQSVHRMLHRALRDAVKWDYLPRNDAEGASPPRVARTRPQSWPPEQLRRFADHVATDRFYALWLMVVKTGMRRGELAGIGVRDLDLEHGRVSPLSPSCGERPCPEVRGEDSERRENLGARSDDEAGPRHLHHWMGEERYLLGQHDDLLFVWPDGRALHPDRITALFHKHCAAAGCRRSARTTFSTRTPPPRSRQGFPPRW